MPGSRNSKRSTIKVVAQPYGGERRRGNQAKRPKEQAKPKKAAAKPRTKSHPVIPMYWKLACADGPTRATPSYVELFSKYGPVDLQANIWDESCVFIYHPALGSQQLLVVSTGFLSSGIVGDFSRASSTGQYARGVVGLPDISTLTSANQRSAISAASLTILCKFPGTAGVLKMRRLTTSDMKDTLGNLSASLDSDIESTTKFDVCGMERINMSCGLHNTEAYGDFNAARSGTFGYYTGDSMSAIAFKFSDVQTGTALPSPALHITGCALWTQELIVADAHTRDKAPERSVVDGKALHGHQSKSLPYKGFENEFMKAPLTAMNSMAKALDNAASQAASAAATGVNIMTSAKSAIDDVATLRRVMPAAVAALAA